MDLAWEEAASENAAVFSEHLLLCLLVFVLTWKSRLKILVGRIDLFNRQSRACPRRSGRSSGFPPPERPVDLKRVPSPIRSATAWSTESRVLAV